MLPAPGIVTASERIQLFLSCRNLADLDSFSKSDPYIQVSYRRDLNVKQYMSVGKTETISNNLNPNYQKTFTLDYIFEMRQDIKFQVMDDDGNGDAECIGSVQTTIGALMGAKNQTSILDLKSGNNNSGKLVVRCESLTGSNQYYVMKFRGQNLANVDSFFDFWDKSDPYLKFQKIRSDQSLIEVGRTETITDNLNPIWKPIELQTWRLMGKSEKFRIECWDAESDGKDQLIGMSIISKAELGQPGGVSVKLMHPDMKKAGLLVLESCALVTRPTFTDYLKGGLQVNLSVAIDFTGSNGTPTSANSLHYMNPTGPNQYQSAILSIGNILMNYDTDKRIQCYGFGGCPLVAGIQRPVSHCFPLSGDPTNTSAQGVQHLISMYAAALKNVSLSGPTYFSEIIRQVGTQAASTAANPFIYHVLLILTDGEIHDMEGTISSLAQLSQLPVSVIIVGVGQADFDNMNKLDGDQGLFDEGVKILRDIVQFVPFREMNLNPELLAKEVLGQVPNQVVQYYTMRGIRPQGFPIA